MHRWPMSAEIRGCLQSVCSVTVINGGQHPRTLLLSTRSISSPQAVVKMLYRESLTFLLFLSVAIGEYLPKRNITWFPCPEVTSLDVTCGFLTVPLDYVNTSSTETLRLSMVKMNASKQPKQGTILLNPGGPGSSGREFLAGADGPGLRIATGGTFDLIGLDPRYVHRLKLGGYLPLHDLDGHTYGA